VSSASLSFLQWSTGPRIDHKSWWSPDRAETCAFGSLIHSSANPQVSEGHHFHMIVCSPCASRAKRSTNFWTGAKEPVAPILKILNRSMSPSTSNSIQVRPRPSSNTWRGFGFEEITTALTNKKVAALFVTSDFNSRYCTSWLHDLSKYSPTGEWMTMWVRFHR
jgi:hypothetical protein